MGGSLPIVSYVEVKEISNDGGKKAKTIEHLLGNKDLLFQWCFCITDLPTEFEMPLLKQIIELFVAWLCFFMS